MTHYEILGINKDATDVEIKKAYRSLAAEYHPDKFRGNDGPFKDIQEAWEVLRDDELKRAYDFSLKFARTTNYSNSEENDYQQNYSTKEKTKSGQLASKLFGGLVLLIIVAFSTSYYFYSQYKETVTKASDPSTPTIEETEALINEMGKVITLPQSDINNGEPTLATVIDKNMLQDQEFFVNAKNGDKVLIYSVAKKAYIYRPSTKSVINVGPLDIRN